MAIKRDLPEIAALLDRIAKKIGFNPSVRGDFSTLGNAIFDEIKEHVSETTLERVWGYSTRGYNNISLRTLNVLSEFVGFHSWDDFCLQLLREDIAESDTFVTECIATADLVEGDRLIIGWRPDRLCRLTYLGDNRFIADETINSKLQPGDTFSCLQFQRGTPLFMENVVSASGEPYAPRLGVGLRNGLSILQIL